MRYVVTYLPDEDGGFIVECPALYGCISHGYTLEEAEANIKDAIRLWLESMNDVQGTPLEVIIGQVEVQAT